MNRGYHGRPIAGGAGTHGYREDGVTILDEGDGDVSIAGDGSDRESTGEVGKPSGRR